MNIISELRTLFRELGKVKFTTAFILITVPLICAVSYYMGSAIFFRKALSSYFAADRAELAYWAYIVRQWSRFAYEFALPLLLGCVFLRKRPRDFGVSLGDWKFGLSFTAIFCIVMLFGTWFASAQKSFIQYYPTCPQVSTDWGKFWLFGASYFLYMTGWEFLWRGYMLFGLKDDFGYNAILIQMIPFTILHFGKPPIEAVSAVAGGIALGILAWRARSFWYAVLVHVFTIVAINFFAVARIRADEYGIGLKAILKILN